MLDDRSINNFALYGFGSVLFLLSLSVVKFSIIQIGQLALLVFFLVLLLDEYRTNSIRWGVLGYMIGFGFLLTLISLASPELKIGEYKFIIKYLFIFPAAYYVGVWAGEKLSINNLTLVLKVNLGLFIAFAVFLWFFPIGFLIHERNIIEFKGTFYESGSFAGTIGCILLSIFVLKLDQFKRFTTNDKIFFVIILLGLLFSRNKSVWLGFIFAIGILLLLKPFFQQVKNANRSVRLLSLLPTRNLLITIIVIIFSLLILNNLIDKPVITMDIIQDKMNNERGKALIVALDLLKKSDWIGAYGFGFIERFFTTFTDTILGLGAGSGMIFDTYLDLWISVGFLGILYHLSLLWLAWDKRSLITMVIPIYWFLVLNVNPQGQSQYYFIFLGICYGYIRHLNTKREK